MWPFKNTMREFVQEISHIPEFTSDLPLILQSRRQPVFACDDLMKAHQGHDLIKSNSRRVGRGFTRSKFDYRVHADSGMGVPLVGNVNSSPLRIKGEIYAVDSEHIKQLDFAYGNGIAYHRVKVSLLVPDRLFKSFPIGEEEIIRDLPHGTIKTINTTDTRRYTSDTRVSVVSAWMYVAAKQYWIDHIDGGYSFPRADIKEPAFDLPWLSRYYKYPISLNRRQP